VDDDEVAQRAPYPRARRVDQLKSNLAALESVLPAEAITRLEAATEFDWGSQATSSPKRRLGYWARPIESSRLRRPDDVTDRTIGGLEMTV
jgi:hypothetical protein